MLFIFSGIVSSAHNDYTFVYDAAGNRVERVIIMQRSAKIVGDEPEEEPKNEPFRDYALDNELILYPNPTKGEFSVEIKNLQAKQKAAIAIYDLQGKLLVQKQVLSYTSFNIVDYPAGTYILHITLDNKEIDWKLIKQ